MPFQSVVDQTWETWWIITVGKALESQKDWVHPGAFVVELCDLDKLLYLFEPSFIRP